MEHVGHAGLEQHGGNYEVKKQWTEFSFLGQVVY